MIDLFEELSFEKIGYWEINNNGLEFKPLDGKNNNFFVNNSIYIFVKNDNELLYVGKTTQSLKKRFYGYSRGNGQSTNNRIHNNIIQILKSDDGVDIYAFNDTTALNWGKYNINLAAGLEDSIIQIENPRWNNSKTETQEIELDHPNDLPDTVQGSKNVNDIYDSELMENQFLYRLTQTYRNLGSINVPIRLCHLLGEHNEDIEVVLSTDNYSVHSTINRTATVNQSVRISKGMQGTAKYFQQHYSLNDFALITINDRNKITIS